MALPDRSRLTDLLGRYAEVRVAVIGDFFLDRYLVVDLGLAEVSRETGRTAHQVVSRRSSPGHAGTVVNNLRALGVRSIRVCGVVGDDGEGAELRKALIRLGADVTHLISEADFITGTYVKPMRRLPGGGEEELDRLDLRNREPMPERAQEAAAQALASLTSADPLRVHAVIVADQVDERNWGVLTDRVRATACELAARRPDIIWYADSRQRIGEYHRLYTKPNEAECRRAMPAESDLESGARLAARTEMPVFLTRGANGMCVVRPTESAVNVHPLKAPGPTDPTGAGDAATAGIVPALALGASCEEAAAIGALVSGLTVRQLGTTGTASIPQVLDAMDEWYG